jgi:hypothetical protein
MKGHPCRVCGKTDDQKPQIFRNEPWCSGKHRKIVLRRRDLI